MATAATERSGGDEIRLSRTTSLTNGKASSSSKLKKKKKKTIAEKQEVTVIDTVSNGTAKNTEQVQRLPIRRRRSSRDTNRILMSASRNGSLQFRRLEELFFQEEDDDDNAEGEGQPPPRRRPRKEEEIAVASSQKQQSSSSSPPMTLRMGKFALESVYRGPNIYVIENFLTANDLEYLQEVIATRQFQQSYVDTENDESILDDSHRTSTFLSFAKQENAKVAAIENKAAELLGCYSTDSIEPLQLVRYLPGQFFGVHHDMGDYNEQTGEVALPPKSVLVKRRLVTIFCYLNDLPAKAGGCTGFPSCDNLQVQPKAGRAVVFCNVMADGLPDPRTIHAGEMVMEKTKSKKKKKKEKKLDKKTAEESSKSKQDILGKKKKKKSKPHVKYGLNIWVCES